MEKISIYTIKPITYEMVIQDFEILLKYEYFKMNSFKDREEYNASKYMVNWF